MFDNGHEMTRIVDRLVIQSFIPPFIVTFSIAVFFFLMQTLWFYIEDIAGKGLGLFFIIEILAYKCVGLIPMALPLATLISSVMVMGNMAEHYELSSFKSAGVSLLRIMRPLVLIAIASALLSYYCSATLIPMANLKFGARLYDIKQQKPALSLEEGVFNDDFQGYSIRIGNKGSNGKTIEDVLIYDHSAAAKGEFSQIIAEAGEMYTTEDEQFFVMRLVNGNQYIEINPSGSKDDFPFVRTAFKEWIKVFDLSQFELGRTNEELFKSNRTMMSIPELSLAIDSMQIRVEERKDVLTEQLKSYFSKFPTDSISYDSLFAKKALPVSLPSVPKDLSPANSQVQEEANLVIDPQTGQAVDPSKAKVFQEYLKKRKVNVPKAAVSIKQDSVINLKALSSILETFEKKDQKAFLDNARTYALSVQNMAESAQYAITNMQEQRVKLIYEKYTKYSIAIVCIIFVFIGAPMGAIVRKGGFGYPILISIIFFMIFIIMTIFCRKIAETFILPAVAAAWVPCIVLLPIGLILTFKAMNDSDLGIVEAIQRLAAKLTKRKAMTT